MNMLKKGPELKLSAIKVPGFLQDIYYDLRDRHLLPLVVLLLVAFVAVPILVGNGERTRRSVPPAISPRNRILRLGADVAKAAPGLRQYEHRLEGEAPAIPSSNSSAKRKGRIRGRAEAPKEATIESSTGGGSLRTGSRGQ